jgi:hypothetical protein
MRAASRFSENVVPLGALKIDPDRVMRQRTERTRPPGLVTSRGRGVPVVRCLDEYWPEAEERASSRAVVKGLMDLETGRAIDVADVKKRLGPA